MPKVNEKLIFQYRPICVRRLRNPMIRVSLRWRSILRRQRRTCRRCERCREMYST